MKRITALLLCLAAVFSLSGFTAHAGDAHGCDPAESAADPSPAWVAAVEAAGDPAVNQLLIVACDGMDRSTAALSMHQRGENGAWEQILSAAAYVGRNGLCPDEERYEGCGKTPIGVYTFDMAFGTADDPGCTIPYIKVDRYKYWSGDMRQGMCYNRMVDIRELPGLDKSCSEHLLSNRYEYKYCLNISFNAEGTPGRGSAIFLHCAGRRTRSTFGCVAVPEKDMKRIMQTVTPGCVVVIDTLENLREAWERRKNERSIDYGASALYSRADMDAAVDAILAEFDTWTGCELLNIRYTSDGENSPENLAWLNSLGEGHEFSECICFLSDFRSPKEAAGAWEPDREYTDWQWWLGRTENGGWELVSWGLG